MTSRGASIIAQHQFQHQRRQQPVPQPSQALPALPASARASVSAAPSAAAAAAVVAASHVQPTTPAPALPKVEEAYTPVIDVSKVADAHALENWVVGDAAATGEVLKKYAPCPRDKNVVSFFAATLLYIFLSMRFFVCVFVCFVSLCLTCIICLWPRLFAGRAGSCLRAVSSVAAPWRSVPPGYFCSRASRSISYRRSCWQRASKVNRESRC